jgi:predicted P-loop ATPase
VGGITVSPFNATETEHDFPRPSLARNKRGQIDASARNLVAAIECPGMIHQHLAYDTFRDALMTRNLGAMTWRRFGDADMVAIRIQLEHRGFAPMGKELLRDTIASVAHQQSIDSAQLWLGTLRWDSVPRVDRFCTEVWGWEDSEYATAVSRYVWSALAGRVMEPGVRADMSPILVGLQGARKTTLIQMMAPDEEMYTEIRLDEKDDNMSRKLRGKLIGELEELRGLNSRAIEEIKAFITRRKEAWVPKFKEFENYFWRRLLMFGTTNETEILADQTGERRWLPGRCGTIDVERMVKYREQYWAEGALMFAMDGVLWQDAERLAKFEHAKFKVGDVWSSRLSRWLHEETDIRGEKPMDKGFVAMDEVLSAIGIMPAHQNRSHELRAQKVLMAMGFERALDDGAVVYRR